MSLKIRNNSNPENVVMVDGITQVVIESVLEMNKYEHYDLYDYILSRKERKERIKENERKRALKAIRDNKEGMHKYSLNV